MPKIIDYRGFTIVQTPTGADLINNHTNKWMTCKSVRYAKWTATFLKNIAFSFEDSYER